MATFIFKIMNVNFSVYSMMAWLWFINQQDSLANMFADGCRPKKTSSILLIVIEFIIWTQTTLNNVLFNFCVHKKNDSF